MVNRTVITVCEKKMSNGKIGKSNKEEYNSPSARRARKQNEEIFGRFIGDWVGFVGRYLGA